MPKKQIDISLIVPCYNEVANLQKGVLDKIGNYAASNSFIREVIIVDDGSTDDSPKLIEEYKKRYSKFKSITNSHQGKAFAIITGIRQAQGAQVMFSDIDLATPIEEVEKLITEYNTGADIVIGSRSADRAGAPLTRKVLAYGLIALRGIFLGLHTIRDTQCGFKLFDTKAAVHIIDTLQVFSVAQVLHDSSVSAGFDLEFLYVARKLGYTIKEVTVIWRHVETKNVHFVHDALETLRDMAKMRYYDVSGKYTFIERK